MTKYIDQELAKYWPVSPELMAQYNDGSHTEEYLDGRLQWLQNGLIQRDSDKPAVICRDGSLIWKQNGLYHRDGDKPAWVGADGTLGWFQNDLRHRSRGPQIIHLDGTLAWWINGKNITEEVTEWLNGEEWCCTPEQIFEFQLRFL